MHSPMIFARRHVARATVAIVFIAVALAAPSRAGAQHETHGAAPKPTPAKPTASRTAKGKAPKVNPADAAFMSGMLHHHAQAIVMSRMAPSHGASDAVKVLTGRIINAQNDDIFIMKQWLREHGLPIPDLDLTGKPMADMPGMSHGTMMPGMLSPAQMQALGAAGGAEFDRLFLSGMIQHHQGAVTMVQELLSHDGAALDREVFKLAADVNVDQTTEIERMRKMLAELVFERRGP